MPTFVLLTRLSPEAAARVATLIRIHGHAQTDISAAVE